MSVILKAHRPKSAVAHARYVLESSKNEQTRVFGIRGTASPDNAYDSLIEIGSYEKLTRGKSSVLPIVMNFDNDHKPTEKEWWELIRRVEKRLGYEGQPFVGVMHTYNGKEHLHATWGRYDYQTGTLKSVDHIGLDLKYASLDHALEFKHDHLLKWQEKKALEMEKAALENDLKVKRQEAAQRKAAKDKADQIESAKQFFTNFSDIEKKEKPVNDNVPKAQPEPPKPIPVKPVEEDIFDQMARQEQERKNKQGMRY